MIVCEYCGGYGGEHRIACTRPRQPIAKVKPATTTPSLVRLDQAEQALDALMAWRAVDIEHGPHTDDGWMALLDLRSAADRIHELSERPGGAA